MDPVARLRQEMTLKDRRLSQLHRRHEAVGKLVQGLRLRLANLQEVLKASELVVETHTNALILVSEKLASNSELKTAQYQIAQQSIALREQAQKIVILERERDSLLVSNSELLTRLVGPHK